ncbi:hypothetical protein AB0D27_08075 [Streptomyces sp. NPDC048415]|uniref:hypothetical protein n=1 Tax=Streptomyces sp. NPDC048415 TaxID=3154822 RepID=UPI00341CCA57
MPSHPWAAIPHTAVPALNPLDTTSLVTTTAGARLSRPAVLADAAAGALLGAQIAVLGRRHLGRGCAGLHRAKRGQVPAARRRADVIVVSLVPVALELRRRRRTAATSPRPPRPVA